MGKFESFLLSGISLVAFKVNMLLHFDGVSCKCKKGFLPLTFQTPFQGYFVTKERALTLVVPRYCLADFFSC